METKQESAHSTLFHNSFVLFGIGFNQGALQMKSIGTVLFVFLTSLSVLASHRVVSFENSNRLQVGSIQIDTSERALYFILSSNSAIRYPVAVPKAGKDWMGSAYVTGRYPYPDWTPPAAVRKDHPELPNVIPGGAANNPMGAAAITLSRSEIAIHGTTEKMRASIGSAASYGCIRMLNEDVSDLYLRVRPGTLILKVP